MHGPLPAEVAASLLSYSSASTSRVTPLSSRLDSTTRQLDREDGTAISGRNDSTGSRTNQPLHSLFAMNHATSSTAVIEYLDKLDKLPDCGKRERIEKRKRTLEALDYLESEMRRLRLNDHKMYARCTVLTNMFLSYLDNFGSPSFPEATTLDAIEESLSEIALFLPAKIVVKDYIDHFPIAVAAWLTYLRAILSVRTAHTTALLPSQILSPFTIKIKSSCLIT
ncbi:hypothetical protein GT037_000201 [Alternaria burnsii]|uniref:Uncharacterized protein n=1 Tax=Alternaria burnsii TaxID=1187904 RepID=A0A8H7BBV5_9PLEO|nr:uncharacterized protein GT037_000201 [Alternaria burnsii]KAF7681225.1 hypothetical protein GT037_000201 [Alternaria burnsii]